MSDDSNTARWREDFPVRWDADHYLTRRELAKFLTLGSGILAAATGALAIAGREAPQALYPAVRIPSATQLLPGTSLLFRYPTEQDPCILIKTGSGELRAYSQVCTHLSCAVRYETEDNRIACPWLRRAFQKVIRNIVKATLRTEPVPIAITVTAARIASPTRTPRSLMIMSKFATQGTKSVITVSATTD